ncbi:MAG: ImmA/IrrE family metallo-endopeptidase, partial [Lentisphaeria bacterium]|nr:ImmA/IrrE family metallo-endopeptidase [Lentisphaeria bacterium]
WLRTLPVADMVRKGWVQKYRNKAEQVLECLRFFGVASVTQWEGVYRAPQAAFRMSSAFASKPGPVAAWLRKGELQSQEIQCGRYDRERFIRVLADLRGLTAGSPRASVPKVVERCANTGVAVVFVPQVKGARCSGTARWLTPTKALIQLSLRYRTNDHLWFSFFHECGHIVLHPKKAVFVEADERPRKTTEELEADRFSANLLVPPADYQRLLSLGPHWSRSTVIRFADGIGVAPGIVVGRLQHDGLLPHTHLNGLKEKYEWTCSA